FSGDFVPLEEGYTRFLSEFNDAASSVRVAPGYCAVLYEHANEFGGYGASLDLLEDCPDLSVYGFDRKTSYVNVFRAEQNGFVWARGSRRHGEGWQGHWGWQRARSGTAAPPSARAGSPRMPP